MQGPLLVEGRRRARVQIVRLNVPARFTRHGGGEPRGRSSRLPVGLCCSLPFLVGAPWQEAAHQLQTAGVRAGRGRRRRREHMCALWSAWRCIVAGKET